MKNIIEVKNLSVKYEKDILKNICLTGKAGELICLIGANGSGKSTLLSSLVRLDTLKLSCSKNSILINGKFIDEMSRYEISKNISLMIQNENCIWNFSVKDFIGLGNYFSNKKEKNNIDEIIDLLDLKYLLNKNINSISGGEFQKVRIARSLVQQSKILLLDEPVSNLDINFQFNLLKIIKQIVKEKNICAIISIHDINLASIFADRIFLLKRICDCEENEEQLLIGDSKEILTAKNLSKTFNADFGIFLHPEYEKTQVFVKGKFDYEK